MGSEEYSYILVEQYATEVLDFSSQYGSDNSISYTAHNITGMPSKFPSYGDFSQTYVMRDYGPWWQDSPSGQVWRQPFRGPKKSSLRAGNFIDVKFDHPVFPIRIHIYETYNPGAIAAIWAGNCQGDWKLLWEKPVAERDQVASERPRIFSPPLNQTSFPTKLIRLEFEQTYLPYYTEIDAVALLGTLDPISNEAKVNQLLPANPGNIMAKIVQRKLHIVPQDVNVIVENCSKQLNKRSLEQFQETLEQREKFPPSSFLGNFEILPEEIVLKILGYLDLISLLQMSAVSNRFREYCEDPFLYTTVDLRDVFYCASSQTLDWLAPRCGNLNYLDLSWCGNYGKIKPSALQQFIQATGNHLSSIRLDNCHVATVPVLDTIVTSCPVLKDLSVSNCHLLKLPDFHLLSQLETLVSLNLYRTNVGHTTIITILCNNSRLRNLSLACCPNIDGDEVCIVLSHCQPELETLDLWRCSTLSDQGLSALAACTKLRDLDLGWCLNISVSSGAQVRLFEACAHLRRIYLTAHRQTGDKELKAISKLRYLEQLDILGNRNITLPIVQELLANVSTLKLLDMSFCEQLGEENIKELRIQYPGVDIKWSFTDAVN